MDAFPLQSELIDGVIGFANADLVDPAKVRRYFSGIWEPEPDEIPNLRTRRTIQADVRLWLMTASGFDNRECYDAMRGLEWRYGPPNANGPTEVPHVGAFKRLDSGIQLKGWLSVEKIPVLGGHEEKIVWNWRVENASLRAICGLAIGTIIQEGLHQKVGVCERESCQNIYLDRTSRGIRRKYCKSEECEKVLNRERVKESRKKVRK